LAAGSICNRRCIAGREAARMAQAEQLSLDLPTAEAMARDDFLPAPSNARALAAIESPDGLPGGLAILCGPAGSGKTHLARLWSARSGARWQRVAGLVTDLPLIVEAAPRPLVLDDAGALAGTPGEEALFHLLNHQRGRAPVLLTASRPPRDWGVRLPDLASRLGAGAHLTLGAPDDALLAAVLVKLFDDRQLRVEPALIAYLTGRIERSLAAARQVVARLDALALQRGRAITRDLAREVLADQGAMDFDGQAGAS